MCAWYFFVQLLCKDTWIKTHVGWSATLSSSALQQVHYHMQFWLSLPMLYYFVKTIHLSWILSSLQIWIGKKIPSTPTFATFKIFEVQERFILNLFLWRKVRKVIFLQEAWNVGISSSRSFKVLRFSHFINLCIASGACSNCGEAKK